MTKFIRTAVLLAVIGFALPLAQSLYAQDIYWTGNGADNNWSTGNNWDGGAAPLSNQDLKFAEFNNQTTNVNDLNLFEPVGSIEFTAAATGVANTSGTTVNADSFTLTGNAVGFFDALTANTITNNSTNLQTLSFTNTGFGGIVVTVPVSIIANNGDFLITSDIGLLGASVTFDGAANTTVTGIIDDSAATAQTVTKNGAGTLELDNDNTYRGGTNINAGTLVVGSEFALGSGDVNLNGGELQTQLDAPRIYVVGGPLVNAANFNANGGTLFTQVGSNTTGVNNDEMIVLGSANLDPGNSGLFVHRTNGYNPNNGDAITIITTPFGGTVNGQFADAPPNAPAPNDFPGLIQPFAAYDATDVDLVFGFAATFASVGKTPNQIATGAALDAAVAAGSVVSATNLIGNLPINVLRHTYDLIAPEELASMYEASFGQGMVTSMNLQRRMDDIRAGATGFCNEGFAIQDNHGYSKNDDKSVASKDVVPQQQAPADTRWGSFITGSGELTKVGEESENDPGAHGYQLNQAGFTMGADYRVTDQFAIGLSGGYTHTHGDLVDNGRLNTDGGRMGLYATYYTSGFYVDAAASGGWNQYDTRRSAFLGQETGSTDGAEFNGMVAAGYDWKKDCWLFGPVASFEYDYVQFNGFTESDTSLLPLHYPDQNENAYRSNLGFRIAHQQNMKAGEGLTVVPELRAAWRHDFGPSAYAIDSNFVGADDTFTVHGPWIGRDSAVVNVGLTAYCTERLSAYIFYDGQFGRDNYNNNGISGGFRVAF